MLIRINSAELTRKKAFLDLLKKERGALRLCFQKSEIIDIREIKKGAACGFLSRIKAFFPKSEIMLSEKEKFPMAAESRFKFPRKFEIIAGPCTIEDRKSYMKTAAFLKSMGMGYIRAPIFKPRQSPYSFQGLGEKGLEILSEVRERYKLKTVSEILSPCQIKETAKYCDMFQVGAANMKNYALLKALSETGKPVLLKRAQGADKKDWLSSAEYVAVKNSSIIFCERGDFGFFPEGGINFNLAAKLKRDFSLCVIADISHSSLGREMVSPAAIAAAAFGLDGIMLEIHENPHMSVVDGKHAVNFKEFEKILKSLEKFSKCLKK